mmetsp:Transcript_28263/g.78005  ORF Transcript_28263/g.78005 Transcript_28263/m.78005 type:complete len:207 (+) Transcript_28263:352-972(+)
MVLRQRLLPGRASGRRGPAENRAMPGGAKGIRSTQRGLRAEHLRQRPLQQAAAVRAGGSLPTHSYGRQQHVGRRGHCTDRRSARIGAETMDVDSRLCRDRRSAPSRGNPSSCHGACSGRDCAGAGGGDSGCARTFPATHLGCTAPRRQQFVARRLAAGRRRVAGPSLLHDVAQPVFCRAPRPKEVPRIRASGPACVHEWRRASDVG